MQHANRLLRSLPAALALALSLPVAACTKPPSDPVGVGEQPADSPERNPGTLPTTPSEGAQVKAPESPENTDSPGTTRTPPAANAQTMDDSDAGPRAGDAGTLEAPARE